MVRNTHLGFGTAVALLIGAGVVSYASLDAYERADGQGDHTLAILAAVDRVLQVAVDAETGTRGFVVTGDEAFLEPRRTASRAAPEAVLSLERLTARSADQHGRARRIGRLIGEKLAWTQRVADARRSAGFDRAKQLMDTAHGNEIMSQIRGLCEQMRAEELAVLTRRRAATERYGRAAKILTILGSSLALLLVLAASLMNRRERLQRERAERALQAAHDALEMHVEERTAQLTRSCRALRMIRTCNQILVRADEEPALLDQICRVIVEIGGYGLAWIGCSQPQGANVMAQAGEDGGALGRMHSSLDEARRAPCPCGRAMRTLMPVVLNDIGSDIDLAPWREAVQTAGYNAVAAFPLVADGAAAGVLSVYAREPDAFDDDEVNLLQELASDVGFGLRLLRLRAEHDAMQAQFIAEQRKTSDRLAAEKERLTVTLRSMGDGLIATDERGRITLLNEVGEKLTGWSEEEAIGQRLGAVFHVLDDPPAAEPLAAERAPPGSDVLGVPLWAALASRDGATKPIEYRSAPLRDRRGGMEGMVLVFRDYSEQRRAALVAKRYDRALRTLAACNEALIRMSDEASLLDAICRIVVNIGGYRMCWVGVPRKQDGKPITPVAKAGLEEGYLGRIGVVWADTEHGHSPVGTAIRTGQPSIARDISSDPCFAPWREEALKRGYASAAALPMLSEGVTLGALAIYSGEVDSFDPDEVTLLMKLANDLAFGVAAIRSRSERNRLATQLMHADRMAATGVLAAGVAHEINNPLAYVQASLDYLKAELEPVLCHVPPEDAAELEQAVADAREGTERIKHIVRDVKTFSRIEEERKDRVDLCRVIDSCARLAFTEIKHRARLVKDYGEVPYVHANDARLGQVFLNLLINAAQAIPEGRARENEIRVATRTGEDGCAVVEVRDSGAGIPQEVLSRIFDPFFTTKPVGVGTGLGLSICHGIVEDLGGEISVESTPGRGTTFRVVLPAAPASLDGREEGLAELPPGDGRRGKILVVDDELSIAAAIRRILMDEHDVLTLTSAREACDKIAHGERYDAILCDLMMPEMTGMDLYSEVASLAPTQADQMLFLTGGTFTSRAKWFLDEVPNPRIEKPFDAQNLRVLVRSVVR